METVDTTTANVGTKTALHAAIVSLSTRAQVKILVTTFMITAIVIAVTVEVIDAAATPLSVTVVAAISAAMVSWFATTLILYANIMTLTTIDRIAVISLPIVVIPVSPHTSLFVTLTVELTLNYNTEQAEVSVAVAEIRTAADRMAEMEVRRMRRQRMLNNMYYMGSHQAIRFIEDEPFFE